MTPLSQPNALRNKSMNYQVKQFLFPKRYPIMEKGNILIINFYLNEIH